VELPALDPHAAASLAGLRGRVVLVRWWTDGCHYCAATLPGLETLRTRYADQGPDRDRRLPSQAAAARCERTARSWALRTSSFGGPIAVDGEWSTLERYWLAGHLERG
jgi:hypothetical protein